VLEGALDFLPEDDDGPLEVEEELPPDRHVLEQHLHDLLLEELVVRVHEDVDQDVQEPDLLHWSCLGCLPRASIAFCFLYQFQRTRLGFLIFWDIYRDHLLYLCLLFFFDRFASLSKGCLGLFL